MMHCIADFHSPLSIVLALPSRPRLRCQYSLFCVCLCLLSACLASWLLFGLRVDGPHVYCSTLWPRWTGWCSNCLPTCSDLPLAAVGGMKTLAVRTLVTRWMQERRREAQEALTLLFACHLYHTPGAGRTPVCWYMHMYACAEMK